MLEKIHYTVINIVSGLYSKEIYLSDKCSVRPN